MEPKREKTSDNLRSGMTYATGSEFNGNESTTLSRNAQELDIDLWPKISEPEACRNLTLYVL